MSNAGLAAQEVEEVLIAVRAANGDATDIVPRDAHFGALAGASIKIDPRHLDLISIYGFDPPDESELPVAGRQERVPFQPSVGAFEGDVNQRPQVLLLHLAILAPTPHLTVLRTTVTIVFMVGWSIGELGKRAGVTPRTVRYYIELGLLAPPESLGRTAGYNQEHLDRLLVIKRLQADRFSLDEIREQLSRLPPAAATQLESDSIGEPPEATSAAQYLARLRQSPGRYALRSPEPFAAANSGQRPSPVNDAYIGEQWTRIPLSEDVELHVKRRGNRIDPRIARLIKEAKQIMTEEQSK